MAKKTSEIFTNNRPSFISESEMSFLLDSDKEYTLGVKDETVSERNLKEYETSKVRRFMNITGEDLDTLLIDEGNFDEDKILITEDETEQEEEEEIEEEETEEAEENNQEEEEKVEDEETEEAEENNQEEEDEIEDEETEEAEENNQEEDDETRDEEELAQEEDDEEFEEVEEEEEEFEDEETERDEIDKIVLDEDEQYDKQDYNQDYDEEQQKKLLEYTAKFVAPWYKSKVILVSLLCLFLLLVVLNIVTVFNFIAVDPSELPNNAMTFSEEDAIILTDEVKEEIFNNVSSDYKKFDQNITTTTNDNGDKLPDIKKATVLLEDLMVFPKFNNYKDITYIKISMEILTFKKYVSIIKDKKMLLKDAIYNEICNMAEERDSKAMPLNRKIIEILIKKLNSFLKNDVIKDIKFINFEIKR